MLARKQVALAQPVSTSQGCWRSSYGVLRMHSSVQIINPRSRTEYPFAMVFGRTGSTYR